MSTVHLTGRLICRNAAEAHLVEEHLPLHVTLTRAEPGCLSFEVSPTADPLVWDVEERFRDEGVFAAHQARVAASEWGAVTAGIERRYSITGIAHS